jgi:predicted ATPase
MRIKSVIVGNYKNIAETKLDLSGIVALVSVNNYGKSNLLEALCFGLDFISASAKQRNNMMRWVKGIPLSPSLAEKDFVFSVEFEEPSLGDYRFVRYGYRFAWHNDTNTGAAILDEIVETRPNESVRYTSYLKRKDGRYRGGKNKTGFRKLNIADDKLALDSLAVLENIEIAPVIAKIQSLSFRMCSDLDLENSFQPIAVEFDFGANTPFDDYDTPRALSVLNKSNPEKFKLFVDTIYDLFPEFNHVELQAYALKGEMRSRAKAMAEVAEDLEKEGRKIPYRVRDELYRLTIDSKYLNQPIGMEHVSSGTKRIFWLVANAIFAGCNGTNILGVDEIETSIHPKMMRNLLEALRDILGEASMIVSSHSPYLIQYLKPDAIYFGVPNSDGTAAFERIQHSKIKTLLNTARDLDVSIGEYMFELMSGDEDSAEMLKAYLETSQ